MERRKHQRLPLNLEAELTLNDDSVYGTVTENISFGGAQVRLPSAEELVAGLTVYLKLLPYAQGGAEAFTIKALVVRAAEERIGLQFLSVDLDGYGLFKDLMLAHSPDPDLLLDELRRSPGLALDESIA